MREAIENKIEIHKQKVYQYWQRHHFRNDVFLLKIHQYNSFCTTWQNHLQK